MSARLTFDDGQTLAWLAGVFEGEGTVTISSAGKRGYTVLRGQLVNTDLDLVQPFRERWGGSITRYDRHRDRGHSPYFRWMVGNISAAKFLKEIQPYIRSAKVREKIVLSV